MSRRELFIPAALLLLWCTDLQASTQPLAWYWPVIGAVIVACVVAWLLVRRSEMLEGRAAKIIGFGAWFWFLIFIQAIVYALIHQFTN